MKKNKVKIIGICEEGILKLDLISKKIKECMDIEKIFPNQEVDKDYVRNLLDEVEIIILVYNSNDKQALQIVNAIDYMAKERKIISIGLDTTESNKKENANVDKEFKFDEKLTEVLCLMSKYETEESVVSIDITDIREMFFSKKEIFYALDYADNDLNFDKVLKNLKSQLQQNNLKNEQFIIMFEFDENKFETSNVFSFILENLNKEYENVMFMIVNSNRENIKVAVLQN